MLEAIVTQDLTALLPENPVARVISLVLILLLGWQGKGFIQAIREDRRTAKHNDVDLLEMVERVTAKKLEGMEVDLEREREERRKLERRVARLERRNLQLELFIEGKQLPVPDWPSHLQD